MNDELRSSRSEQRSKRRKTNLILNGLIAIVLILIVVISANIFFDDNSKDDTKKDNKIETKQESTKEDQDNTAEDSSTTESEDVSTDMPSDTGEDLTQNGDNEPVETNGEAVETEGGSDESVQKTIVNPSWQPVGTTQTGEHSAVYDSNSADWKEMLKAISYGSGVEESNMTVLFLGNNGPNKSVGNILAKSEQKKYRVFIEWVEGEGWKPTKVEVLK
ncbi:DUF1510 family protein [Bacillus massilinigeriensis]|uniref:DUF1510 family protein n=1 Tax=Bacillus massilionigeriensis TaxID=1805475 RepID=UPI00096B61CF|nr:DUF1510 family protein [Bacillus massilionigeriensis]